MESIQVLSAIREQALTAVDISRAGAYNDGNRHAPETADRACADGVMRLGSQRRILRERRDEAMKIIVTFGPVIGAAIMAVYVFVLRIYVSAKELLFCAA